MIKILLAIHLFSFAVAAGGGVANMLAARSARGAAAEAARAIGGCWWMTLGLRRL